MECVGKQEPKVKYGRRGHGVVSTMGQGGKVASGVLSVSISASEVVHGLEPSSKIIYHYGAIGKVARGTPICHWDGIRVGSHARSWHPKMGVTNSPVDNGHRCRGDYFHSGTLWMDGQRSTYCMYRVHGQNM